MSLPESEEISKNKISHVKEVEYQPMPGFYPCQNVGCLLSGSPPVGVTPLEPRPMSRSLLARTEGGASYKMGNGKVTRGNVEAAYDLLKREYPEVSEINEHKQGMKKVTGEFDLDFIDESKRAVIYTEANGDLLAKLLCQEEAVWKVKAAC